MTARIEHDEVQGNVLHTHGIEFAAARHRFFRVDEGRAGDAARTIGEWARRVSFGRRADKRGDLRPHVNLALTFAGLRALELPDRTLAAFPEDFRQGAIERSPVVGDRGHNAPAHWEEGLGTSHVLLTVHAVDAQQCAAVGAELEAAAAGLTPVGEPQPTGLLARPERAVDADTCGVAFNREHFGFADGCSQPAIEGVDGDPDGDGVYARVPRSGVVPNILQDTGLLPERRAWRLIRAGEFVLGYDSEDGRWPPGPEAPLGPNGTFMVYRKLAQDVTAFRDHMERWAGPLGFPSADALAAKVVGRTVDGVPLARPVDGAERDRLRANAFVYGGDRWGYGCPLGAHVRRTNPRDALAGGAEVTMRHRIIRRGMPYGPPPQAGGDADRGLLFICYMASIANGFEFIQRDWCYGGEAFGLPDEQDFLMQQEPQGPMTIQRDGKAPLVLPAPDTPLVSVRGCEYLFVPSRRACEWLGDPERL